MNEKFLSERWLLRLVPVKGGADVILGPRAKNDCMRHERWRMRAKTSSKVSPEVGSASYSASLRSSSSRCHGVSGNDSGAADMLAQMASTRRMRSATGSSRISATRAWSIAVSVPLIAWSGLVYWNSGICGARYGRRKLWFLRGGRCGLKAWTLFVRSAPRLLCQDRGVSQTRESASQGRFRKGARSGEPEFSVIREPP